MKKFNFLFPIIFVFLAVAGCAGQSANIAGEKISNDAVPKRAAIPAAMVVPPVSNSDHIRGNLYAPVTVIIYSDFECPFCASFEGASGSIEQAKEAYGDSLRFVFRHYPLSFHAEAKKAAEASECASEQGKFWEMHDLLFTDSQNGRLSSAQSKTDAQTLGLDTAAFNECLDSGKYSDMITQSAVDAENLGVRGTPNAFVNGRHVIGAIPYDDYQDETGVQPGLRTIIAEALQK